MESPTISPVLKLARLLIPLTKEPNHTVSTMHNTVSLRSVSSLVSISQHQLSHIYNPPMKGPNHILSPSDILMTSLLLHQAAKSQMQNLTQLTIMVLLFGYPHN